MGIFDTTADTNANGFYGPQNAAFNNPGWQVDPNLMTPSYAAPYRPQYGGSNPYQNASNPGFFRSAGHLINPFRSEPPLFQTSGQAAQPYFDSAVYRPPDAAMSLMQKYVLPGLAAGAAMKYLGPNTGSLMGDIAGTFTGAGPAGAFGRSLGRGVASGAMRGLGLAGTGALASGATGAAGLIGGTLGAAALPLLAGQAAMTLANDMVFDPYSNDRATGRSLRENFSGVTFQGNKGDVTRGGRGLSYHESGKMAGDITRSGIQDFTFSTDEYTEVANMAGRSGMLDGTKSGDITKKIKSIAEQVKMIVQISQDPSIQGAIEELTKLQQGGADISGGRFSAASQAYGNIGMEASAAGTTVKRLMSRVGQQGQMLYSMNGMTPYMGQMAAANTYAGFASGHRSGLIGDAQLARMGGMEGATQSAMTGSINALQTPYARMLAYNQYIGGADGSAGMGQGQDIASVVGRFGKLAGGDPLELMGNQLLVGNQLSARMVEDGGSQGIENMALAQLRAMGQRTGKGGSYSPAKLAVALQNMGMSQEQISAFMTQRASETDEGSSQTRIAGYNSQAEEQTLATLSSEGLTGTLWGAVAHSIEKGYKNVKEGSYGLLESSVLRPMDRAGDSLKGAWRAINYGSSYKQGDGYTISQLHSEGPDGAKGLESAGYTKTNRPKSGRILLDESGSITDAKDTLITRGPWGNINALDGRQLTEKNLGVNDEIFTAPFKGFDFEGNEAQVKKLYYEKIEGSVEGGMSFDDSKGVLKTVERLAKDLRHPGNKLATQFMMSKDPEERKGILSKLTRSHAKEFKENTHSQLFVEGYDPSKGLDNASRVTAYATSSQTKDVNVLLSGGQKEAYASSVNKVLGDNDFNMHDDLRVIGKVDDLARKHSAGDMDATNIDEFVSKDALLKKFVGDRRGKTAFDFVTQVHNRARAEGHLNKGRIASSLGGLEEAGRKLSSPELREKFKLATTEAEKLDIISQETLRRNGGTTSEAIISGDLNMSLSQSAKATEAAALAGKKIAKESMNTASKAVDYKGFTDLMGKFDKSSEGFGKSVEAFSKVIKEDLPKALGQAPSSSTSTPPPGASGGWLHDFGARGGVKGAMSRAFSDNSNNLDPAKK